MRIFFETIKSNRAIAIVPLGLLMPEEKHGVLRLNCSLLDIPNLEDDISEVLGSMFGEMGKHLFNDISDRLGKRPRDIRPEDLCPVAEELESFFKLFIEACGCTTADEWHRKIAEIPAQIRGLGEIDQVMMDRGSLRKEIELPVTEREIEPMPKAAYKQPGEIAVELRAFLRSELGNVGMYILDNECRKLGKNPDALTSDDLDLLGKGIEQAVVLFGEVASNERVRADWTEKGRLIRESISNLTGKLNSDRGGEL